MKPEAVQKKYLVFIRKAYGRLWYLDGDTPAGSNFSYTDNRVKAERCTRDKCVEYMRKLLETIDKFDEWVPGFEVE